jgi:hypothetical protein
MIKSRKLDQAITLWTLIKRVTISNLSWSSIILAHIWHDIPLPLQVNSYKAMTPKVTHQQLMTHTFTPNPNLWQ